MPEPATDHRRAIAERNAAAIADAAMALLERRHALSMAAIAAEAGVSRQTLYAHHRTIADVLEAAVARAVQRAADAFEAAEPEHGDPAAALERLAEASWNRLTGLDALKQVSAEHLSSERVHRAHAPLVVRVRALAERGQAEGAFRRDLDPDWLAASYFALVHAADDHARASGTARGRALEQLLVSLRALFAGVR